MISAIPGDPLRERLGHREPLKKVVIRVCDRLVGPEEGGVVGVHAAEDTRPPGR